MTFIISLVAFLFISLHRVATRAVELEPEIWVPLPQT